MRCKKWLALNWRSVQLCMLGALLCAVMPISLMAQIATAGRISGSVTDTSQSALPGATVTLANEATGISRTVTTDSNGFYVATNLPVGSYKVSAEEKGFGKDSKTGNRLDADGRVTVNFVLKPGGVTETVEVTASGETVNTTSGEISRVVDQNQVQNLALNGRNYMQLVSLVPGVAVADEDQIAQTYGVNISNQSVNGTRTDQNLLTVDGGFNLDSGSNGSPINNVGIDFIQEVSIKTSNFSAEYGRVPGSAINVVTRSGSNSFHGGLFEFVRNDALDAKNYFSPICTVSNPCAGGITDGRKQKQILRFNDYGGDLGGPIFKNKLFFFVGEEWKAIRQNMTPNRATLPSGAMLSGNFSGISGLTLTKPANAPAGCTITNNVMSPQCITPDGQAFAKLYTAMAQQAASFTNANTSNNAIYQPFQPYNWRQDLYRLDYHINDKQSMYFRYLHDNFILGLPFGFSCASTSQIPSCPQNRKRPGYSYQLSHTWVITPTLVNQASFNAAWNGQRLVPTGDSWKRDTYGFTFPQIFGATGGGRFRNSVPDINLDKFAGISGQSHALLSPTTDIAPSDNLTWTRGNHSVKTGVLIIRNRKDQNARSLYAGQATFKTSGNSNTTGHAVADMLMGNFQDYQEASDDPVGLFRFTQYQAYVSDNWKVLRNLSLELGIRYQYAVPTYTLGNDIANFDPSTYDPSKAVTVKSDGSIDTSKGGNPLNGLVRAGSGVPSDQLFRYSNGQSAGVLAVPAGAPRGLYRAQNLWAPRIGFAWAPYGNGKTSIRGGLGIFYDTPEGNIVFPLLSNPPFIQNLDLTSGNISNPLAGKPAAAAVLGNISAIDPHLQLPYTMSYSLSVQRELPAGVFLEVAYVGNEDRHLIRKPDINMPGLAVLAAKAPATGTTAIASGLLNSIRPYKGYSAINMFTSDSTGNYNAFQTYLTKRKGDLQVSVGYTWSKTLTDSTSITDTSSDNVAAAVNRHYSYGPAPFSRNQVIVTSYTYSAPFFRDQHGFVGHLAGGWELSGITRAQSGEPFTVRGANGLGSVRADYLGGPINISNPTPDHWFNTAAFVVAPINRLGTAGVGQVHGPGLFTWDLSLRKAIPLPKEGWQMRFQADMFNILNHSNFRFDSITSLTPANTTVTDGKYGTVTAAGPPRQIQFGLKLMF
jgi:Carboxypeptidase regulatory-like domain